MCLVIFHASFRRNQDSGGNAGFACHGSFLRALLTASDFLLTLLRHTERHTHLVEQHVWASISV